MNTKLILWLDEKLIASAKRHSAASGRSVSQLVADFFSLLEAQSADVEVTPRLRALRGVLAGSGLDEGEYIRQLEDKHL
ncbi:MAG TPA: antitoxin [Synechococcales bacterium UBA10510]|nr:antitoxin [Synechococcales bacterium UBA10510]